MINIALISPSQNAYSETFIQAHKNNFDANVFYYYSDITQLEGYGTLSLSRWEKRKRKLKLYLCIKQLSIWELSVIKSFKKHNIQKVYAEYGTTGVRILPICEKMNIPLIVNFHGFDISAKEFLDIYKDKYKELLNYAESIVVVSKLMKEKILELGGSPDKIAYTPCAPDNSFFAIDPKFTEKSLVAVGRFVEKKAPYYTILAFKKVLEVIPDAKLYMCGDGLLYAACQNLINYYNLNTNIYLLGSVSPEKIKDLYSKSFGFVQHSITALNGDMEGTPVGVLEASAAGLPVISTRHAGIPDVVLHEKTGLLVEEHNVDEMADMMIKILSNKKYGKELGAAGRKFVHDNFSMKRHIAILDNLLYK